MKQDKKRIEFYCSKATDESKELKNKVDILNKEIIELHSKIKNIYIFTKQYIETSELIKELEILSLVYDSIYLTKNIYYKNDNKNKKIRILKEDLKFYCNDLKNDLLTMFKLVNENN